MTAGGRRGEDPGSSARSHAARGGEGGEGPRGPGGPGEPGEPGDLITWDQFARVDIRVGRIVEALDFPQARKAAYRLRIDFGALGIKTSSAQITRRYARGDLVGRLVLAVVNFPPRQIATFFSEVLTLGVVLEEGDIVLVEPERDVPLGSRIA